MEGVLLTVGADLMDTGAEGGNMVFVKVRETYDLHTVKNKMSVISIHTPKPDIIKRNYPGLLMQCKAYRPVSADVKIACASIQSLDPLQVGTAETDIAPEDVFNPILYKAMSNFGMSQLEARINALHQNTLAVDVDGDTATVDVNTATSLTDEFPIYYGLLSETHNWKHANPQAGLVMTDLKPVVWDVVYNIGDNSDVSGQFLAPMGNSDTNRFNIQSIRGGAKPMPFINTTMYTSGMEGQTNHPPGFSVDGMTNCEQKIPWIHVVVGAIIIPPSRLHELFYRMVVEWTLEFSAIRSFNDIVSFNGLAIAGNQSHYQNYNYSETRKAVTGSDETILKDDTCMVSANVDVNKVM